MIINARKRGRDIVTLKQMGDTFEVKVNDIQVYTNCDFEFAFRRFMEV